MEGYEVPAYILQNKSRTRLCKISRERFCYICGKIHKKSSMFAINSSIISMYESYFKDKLADYKKTWAPPNICTLCNITLYRWKKNKNVRFPFTIPMVWRIPKNHINDCLFCMMDNKTLATRILTKTLVYPDLESARRPIMDNQKPPPKSSKENIDLNIVSENDEVSSFC